MIHDTEAYGYDEEAVGPRDADIQQAQWTAEANRLQALRQTGVCTHRSNVGRSASGEIYYPEQVGLRAGQVACTEHTGGCDEVFESREQWHRAHMAF